MTFTSRPLRAWVISTLILTAPAASARDLCARTLGWVLQRVSWDHQSYRRTRPFEEYVDFGFPLVLTAALGRLGPEASVGEGGAGEAVALREILDAYPNLGRGTAVSLEEPELSSLLKFANGEWQGRFRHVWGKTLESMPPAELGLQNIWLDVMGAFTYSDRPDLVLETYLTTLARGGAVFIHTYESREQPSWVRVGSGRVNLLDWLGGIENLRVTKPADGSRVIEVIDPTRPVRIPRLRLSGVRLTRRRPLTRTFVVEPEAWRIVPPRGT